MKTPENIKMGLKRCYNTGSCLEDCPYRKLDFPECVIVKCDDALAYIQQLEDKVPRWISVEERLPEVDTGVLVAVRHMQTGQFYVRYDWRIKTTERCWWWKKTSESNVADLLDVTHWMPLPEPPKEGTC